MSAEIGWIKKLDAVSLLDEYASLSYDEGRTDAPDIDRDEAVADLALGMYNEILRRMRR